MENWKHKRRQFHKEMSCELHKKIRKEFSIYHKCLRWLRPVILLINLLLIYLFVTYVSLKAITVILAVFFITKESIQLYILWRLEKRIFNPIEKLKEGVEQISQGNYDIRIDCDIPNEIGVLIQSFNNMAHKLQEGVQLQAEYEENRKTLVANISHDLKTPITAIRGYVEALMDDVVTEPEKRKTYLRTIHSNIAYINNLIDDLFLFSKLDLQKLQFDFKEAQAKPFMSDLMEEFKIELEEKEVQFNYIDSLQQDVLLNIDGKRIQQAIRNIIGNAVKYGLEKGIVIETLLEEDEHIIRLLIKDNGPGIPEDKLPYIFNSFYRIDSERTKDLMSTGLGLSIARELVEAHGGEISVESSLGAGSCFIISIPKARKEA